jgi:predicted amidohydrolase
VPYGEYLPMRPILSLIGLQRLVPGDFDFDPGPGPRAMAFPGFGAVGMQICYEIIFSGQVIDEQHRPAVLFNPSNDSWYGSWGPPEHLAQARMRAIEEGLPILRAIPDRRLGDHRARWKRAGQRAAGQGGRDRVAATRRLAADPVRADRQLGSLARRGGDVVVGRCHPPGVPLGHLI